MKYLAILITVSLWGCHLTKHEIKEGDLLFKETKRNVLSDAISNVTDTTGTYRFSHIGVLIKDKDQWQVIESTPGKGVRICPLEAFCLPAKGEEAKVVVGRLKEQFPFDLEKLKEYAYKQIDKPYDYPFVWNDSAFYCSELVYKMFVNAGQTEAFALNVMTFKQAGEEQFDPTWIHYFQQHQAPIPEGKMGINPNAMAKSQAVELLFELEH